MGVTLECVNCGRRAMVEHERPGQGQGALIERARDPWPWCCYRPMLVPGDSPLSLS